MRRLLGGIVLLGFLAAYPMGGRFLPFPDVTAGDVFLCINGSEFITASNTVQVDTLIIDTITVNALKINIGQTNIAVTMSVFNTSDKNMILGSADLRFLSKPLAELASNEALSSIVADNSFLNYTKKNLNMIIPARTTVDITYNISAVNDPALYVRADPLVIDGYLTYSRQLPISHDDSQWRVSSSVSSIYNGMYQYAARVTASLDSSGQPEVSSASITIAPDPASFGIVTVTVNFSKQMDMLVSPTVTFNIQGNERSFFGGWYNNKVWVGTYDIQDTWNGIAWLSVTSAKALDGEEMRPAYDVKSFVIDTLAPELSVHPATQTANVGMKLLVVFVADEALAFAPQIQLVISENLFCPVQISTNIDQITWNGSVVIPSSAMPYIGEIATFNLLSDYADLAGNQNNFLGGVTTVQIAEAVPVVVTVNFDTVPAYPGLVISPEPFISVFVHDYKEIGLDAASVRITVDGVLAYSGPAKIYKIAEQPYWTYQFDWQYEQVLSIGDHSFEFGLMDSAGLAAMPYTINVRVNSRNTDLVKPPVPVPNPFSPKKDEETFIVYQLTKSTDVNIYIYDINGNVVWRRFIAHGQEGAHAGLNRVPWNGRSSFNNTQLLPNGVYIAHILVDRAGEKKSLGRTKILLLN